MRRTYDVFSIEKARRLTMRKFLILGATVAALGLLTVAAPADAADQKTNGVTAGQAVQMDLSAHRYHRRYYYHRHHRHYRYYGYYHYHRRYYGGPYYYYPYPYYYRPRA